MQNTLHLIFCNYDLRPTIFSNIQGLPQNSRCQKGDMKQVTQWGPTVQNSNRRPGPVPLIMTIHFTAVPYDGLLNFIRNCGRHEMVCAVPYHNPNYRTNITSKNLQHCYNLTS